MFDMSDGKSAKDVIGFVSALESKRKNRVVKTLAKIYVKTVDFLLKLCTVVGITGCVVAALVSLFNTPEYLRVTAAVLLGVFLLMFFMRLYDICEIITKKE
jgi:cytochrome c biogenesis protein CcdA